MTNIIDLPVITTLDASVSRVLERVRAENLKSIVVLGYTQDGDEFFASSIADGGEVVWQLERAKFKLLRIVDEE